MSKPEIILVEPMMPAIEARLDADYTVHRLFEPAGRDAALAARPRIRAVSPAAAPVSAATGSRRCPRSASSRSTASAPIASTSVWPAPAAST